jgi:acetyl esterase/lipase
MKNIIFLFLLLSTQAFAQPRDINPEKKAIQSSQYWLDVDYVGDGIIGHRLDIHLPKEGKAPFPIVVVVYGSAFFSNSSKANAFKDGIGQYLLNNGFAVVAINHRASTDSIFPAQMHDVKAAIRYVRANAAKFSMDNSFMGITGWSSGGHLSSFAGTTNGIKTDKINGLDIDIEGHVGNFLTTSSQVDAVVDWFGPTDFLIMDKCGSTMKHDDVKSPESTLIGGAIQDNKEKTTLANPITYVNKTNPPFLIFHGDKDPLVPHCQSEKLYEKMQKQGVKSELVIIKDGGHGPSVMIDQYFDKMITFFKNELKNSKK